MIIQPGQRLGVHEAWTSTDGRARLQYQADGHLVLLVDGVARIGSGAFAESPGYVEMQHDGNLVAYDAQTSPYWASGQYAPGASLLLSTRGLALLTRDEIPLPDFTLAEDAPPPPPIDRIVRPLVGLARVIGRSFGDETGPRVVHGYSDFGLVAKFHQDADAVKRGLDLTSKYQQFVRFMWRLNGWHYTPSGLSCDPSRDSWWESAVRGLLAACHERGLRVSFTNGDLNNWTDSQAEDGYRRAAQIAASVSPEVVWLGAGCNELRSVHEQGETDENIAKLERWMRIWQQYYPWSLRAITDPGNQAKDGMIRMSGGPANVALVHNTRWSSPDAIRRAFNARYENDPGKPIVEDEPTGPNGSATGPHARLVYQPTEDPAELAALYTMHVITGQASTYFSDPGLCSREPIDSTWGFKELPALWRRLDIPEDIGQGTLMPGHRVRDGAPLDVMQSNALRADAMSLGSYHGYHIGVISGGSNWRVRAGVDGQVLAMVGTDVVLEGRVSAGEVILVGGPKPTIVRIVE